jgi:hypothetical protein
VHICASHHNNRIQGPTPLFLSLVLVVYPRSVSKQSRWEQLDFALLPLAPAHTHEVPASRQVETAAC